MSKPHHMATYDINNIECGTKKYAVDIIIPFLPKDRTIWAPFDKEDSNFVKYLREKGFKVVSSHIDEGKDFFTYQPPMWSLIVSNPPFKNKTKFVERALALGKPFALILPLGGLSDNGIPNAFMKHHKEIELLIPIQRMEFNNQPQSGISFKCAYFCWGMFCGNPFATGRQIIFCDMKKDDRD